MVAIIFGIAIDVSEWLKDYEQRDPVTGKPKRDFYDLFAKVGLTITKAVVSAALGAAVVALGATLLGLAAAPVILLVVGTVVASMAIGYGLDNLDKKFDASNAVAKGFRGTAEYLDRKHPNDFGGYQNMADAAAPVPDLTR